MRKTNKRRFSVSANRRVRAGRKINATNRKVGRGIMASTFGGYDYLESMVQNIIDNFDEYNWEYEDRDELEEQMNDDLWDADEITGNASGSYFFNAAKARDAIRGNEDLLIEAIEEFGDRPEDYKKALTEPEWADVTIRCYMLGQAIGEALDRMGIR